jgi:hypothetical protein
MRFRAIVLCLFYGIMPWQVYETTCHYKGMSYAKHLTMNLRYALDWAFFRETEDDIAFEKKINPTWF